MAKLNKLQTASLPEAVLDRRQAVPALIQNPQEFLIVAGLAGTAWEISALTHEAPSLFGLGGAMGAAPMIAVCCGRRHSMIFRFELLMLTYGAISVSMSFHVSSLRHDPFVVVRRTAARNALCPRSRRVLH